MHFSRLSLCFSFAILFTSLHTLATLPKANAQTTNSQTTSTEEKTHSVIAVGNSFRYDVTLGGTMDGENTFGPPMAGRWTRKFQPNISVRMENIGKQDVVNPWLTVNGKRSWRTLEDIVEEATRGLSSDREKAIGLWRFIAQHVIHWSTGDAEAADPVKLLNVYGFALCSSTADALADLWRIAGLPVRRGFPQGHGTTEVFYDGGFHHLDADVKVCALMRDNKTVASEADLVRDHDLTKRTHTYGIGWPDDRMKDEFTASLLVYEGDREGEPHSYKGHSMNFVLRPGEFLEWRWDNVGRYHSSFRPVNTPPFIMAMIANGLMQYSPELPAVQKQKGMIWDMHSPYIVVGGQIKGTFPPLEKGSSAKLLLSFDQKRWTDLYTASAEGGPFEVDLASFIPPNGRARYDFYVKLETNGRNGLSDLTLKALLQMAPNALPALELGKNDIRYVSESQSKTTVRITHTWRESSDSRPPLPPREPLYPIDSDRVNGTTLVFRWTEAVDPDQDPIQDYQFQLADRPDFAWPLSTNFDRLISKTKDRGKAQFTLAEPGLLRPNTRYYWRVRARDSKGVWSRWSRTWNFRPRGPGIPLKLEMKLGPDHRTATLSWTPNPDGTRPVKYRIYGSNEKGFSARDLPYEMLSRSFGKIEGHEPASKRTVVDVPSNYATEVAGTKAVVVGESAKFPNTNRAFYRVVAEDADGIRSGPSDFASVPRPLIYSKPATEARVGEEWEFSVRTITSIGDLRSRTFASGTFEYNQAFWDKERVELSLEDAPKWVKVDQERQRIYGTPTAVDQDADFVLIANVPGVGSDAMRIQLKVVKDEPKTSPIQ